MSPSDLKNSFFNPLLLKVHNMMLQAQGTDLWKDVCNVCEHKAYFILLCFNIWQSDINKLHQTLHQKLAFWNCHRWREKKGTFALIANLELHRAWTQFGSSAAAGCVAQFFNIDCWLFPRGVWKPLIWFEAAIHCLPPSIWYMPFYWKHFQGIYICKCIFGTIVKGKVIVE